MRKVGYLKDNEELVVKDGVVYAKEKFNINRWAAQAITSTSCRNVDFYYCDSAKTVIAYYISGSGRSYEKPGIAICHKDDRYDRTVGKAIALCRLKGIKIPKEVFED